MPCEKMIKSGMCSSILRFNGNRFFSNVTVKKVGPVTCIGINRPAKKNCLNIATAQELKSAIESFEIDEKSSVGVLYGERGTFSHGYDPDEFKENPQLLEDIESVGLLEKYPLKPIVAAVSGHALGLGFDLALWCDFRIIEETALLGGYARRFGMPTKDIILQRMFSMLGLNKAMDLILTGRLFTPKEALESDIATRIVACGSGLGQSVNFAHSLANVPQSCLKADRAALISLSRKFSKETANIIKEEIIKQRNLATNEAKQGLHVTETGDVRQKGF